MARTDVLVLGAGIVGTSIALHLAKRGLAVALIDRARCRARRPPTAMPGSSKATRSFRRRFRATSALLRDRAQARAGGELSRRLPAARRAVAGRVPCVRRGRSGWSRPRTLMRPLFARAVAEHEALMAESGRCVVPAQERLAQALIAAIARSPERRASATSRRSFGIPIAVHRSRCGARARAVAAPVFRHAVFWPKARQRHQSARGDARLCGALFCARRRAAHRRRPHACAATAQAGASTTDGGAVDADAGGGRAWAVGARSAGSARHPAAARHQARLSPALPAAWQRGSRRARCLTPISAIAWRRWSRASGHHRRRIRRARRAADAGAVRPPAAGRARALFARRAGRADTVDGQHDRALPDSRPVIGRAPGQSGLWLAFGHAPLGTDARRRDRPAHGRTHDWRDPVL